MPRFARRHRHHRRRPAKKKWFRRTGFTLIETMVIVGIIGAIASVIVPAINPAKNLGDAFDVKRANDAANLNTAFHVYYLNHSAFPDHGKIPENPDQWINICRQGVSHVSCLDASALLAEELAAIPLDEAEKCPEWNGFVVHRIPEGVGMKQVEVKPKHLGRALNDTVDTTGCPSLPEEDSSASGS